MQYGFGEELTKDNILKKITSYDIFKYYSENFREINKSFPSDFRKENNPSCQITTIKGDLLYSDFGLGKSFRCFSFVMELYHISYFEALEKVNLDFGLGLGNYPQESSLLKKQATLGSKIKLMEKSPTILKIKKRKWNESDRDFWFMKYYIDSKTLEAFGVVPISHFWINDNEFVADKCAYSYNFYWGGKDRKTFYRKIYQPYNKKLKWISNGGKVCQGEGMLPKKGDLLIVTKALKDVMVLYLLGYHAVAPPSESVFLPDFYYTKQNKRFDKMVLLLDNDKTGLTKAEEFSKTYTIEYKYIPIEYGVKDISDFIEKYGVKESKLLLKQLFNNVE
jgi:hypothetical protein